MTYIDCCEEYRRSGILAAVEALEELRSDLPAACAQEYDRGTLAALRAVERLLDSPTTQ